MINSIECTQALVVTGSSTGLAAGAALTVVINSVTYGATVFADGSWSVGVPAADVTNWPAGTVNIAVSALIPPEPQPALAIRSRSIRCRGDYHQYPLH